MKMNISPQLKNPRFFFMVLADSAFFVSAIFVAYLFRFEFSLTSEKIIQIKNLMIWMVPLKLVAFYLSGLYRGMWRYTSVHDFWALARASAISSLIVISAILYMNRFEGYSRAVFIIDGFLTFLFAGSLRMVIRTYFTLSFRFGNKPDAIGSVERKKIVVVGAGDAGEKILREIQGNDQLAYQVMGFMDDDPVKRGKSIHGVRVLGSAEKIPKIVGEKGIEEVLIAIPSASGSQIRNIVEACRKCKVSYKVLPGIGELIDGKVSVKMLRDVDYEDLLGRLPVKLDVERIDRYMDGKTIMVTGCGGSIGAELCRQIIRFNPRHLILLDASELNLFNIEMEIRKAGTGFAFRTVLGNVVNEKLMEDVFKTYKPQVIFHAAAYKHVPMQEKNPWEAVFNNIVGSRVVMDACIRHRAECFVLVSTDKAVRPTNVMGVTKRVAELIMQPKQNTETRMIAVRFGNVIGSSGSVMPVFRRQIEQGGPVTVTHPEATRYFMTIPEASQLILQAAAMGRGGEIFILKMGTPVKIDDMARDLIRLSGREPDVDIEIVYTGLREGEKLHEELITEEEDILPTEHEKIMVLRPDGSCNDIARLREKMDKDMGNLLKYASDHDSVGIKKALKDIVPEYVPQKSEAVL